MTLSGLINDTPRDSLTGKPYSEPTEAQPTNAEVEAMLFDRDCWATDGSDGVDPDGTCCGLALSDCLTGHRADREAPCPAHRGGVFRSG